MGFVSESVMRPADCAGKLAPYHTRQSDSCAYSKTIDHSSYFDINEQTIHFLPCYHKRDELADDILLTIV